MKRPAKERPIEYAHSETLEDLSRLMLYEEVDWGKHKVKELPLVSFGYHNCNAIALSDGRRAGLSHSNPEGTNILYQIEEMVGDFAVEPDKLKAIIVAGLGMENIKKYCRDLYIEVVGPSFQGDSYYNQRDERFFYPRDVLVLPSLREVVIYTHEGRRFRFFDSYSNFPRLRPPGKYFDLNPRS